MGAEQERYIRIYIKKTDKEDMMLLPLYYQALRGYQIWRALEKKYRADAYILMPKKDEVYNSFALLYLDEFLAKKREEQFCRKVLVMTHDPAVGKALPLFSSDSDVQVCDFSRKNAECLIRYYALYEFTTKLTIISLTEPYDTCAENLIGVNGVTKEELLCYDIYRLDDPRRKPFPTYTGDDMEIAAFIARGEAGRI